MSKSVKIHQAVLWLGVVALIVSGCRLEGWRQVKKIIAFFALASIALAACGGDGDGTSLDHLRVDEPAAPPQAQSTPVPQVVRETVVVESPFEVVVEQTVVVEKTVVVEVPVEILATIEVPVEIVREVIVTATPDVQAFAQPTPRPTNGVRGYADASACDMRTPQPTPRTGDIDVLFGCTNAWETAVAYSHQPQGGK